MSVKSANALAVLALFLGSCATPDDSPTDLGWLGSVGPPGTGSAEGTYGGDAFVVRSAISANISAGSGGNTAVIILSSKPDICSKFQSGFQPYGVQYLSIYVFERTSSAISPPTAPGNYDVQSFVAAPPPGHTANIQYLRIGNTCSFSSETNGVQGQLTISAINGATYTGSADYVSDTGEHERISFTTTPCSSTAVSNWISPGLSCN